MDAGELKDKGVEELNKLEHELSEKLFGLRLKHAIKKLRETADIRKVRKDIARIKTVLKEKG